MTYTWKISLPIAALVAGLAAAPASAQMIGAPLTAGQVHGGGAIGGGGFGGHAGGGVMAAPRAPAAAPTIIPQGRGGGFAAPRHGGGLPGVNGWSGAAPMQGQLPGQPRAWHRPGGVAQAPSPGWRNGRHHGHHGHHGRGHWRGGVWIPYVVGGYEPYYYGGYADDEYCVLRKVRVHTRHGWRKLWRRVCT